MNKKLGFIDALRGLAIFGVLVCHCAKISETSNYFNHYVQDFFNSGAKGVQLFFVMSAYTLFLSFQNRKNERYPIVNFFIRRFFRIAPMFYVGVIYFIWQFYFDPTIWIGSLPTIKTSTILANIFFVHGFHPELTNCIVPGSWSIADEMVFYSLLPILFLKINNINKAFYFFLSTLIFRAISNLLFLNLYPDTYPQLKNEFQYFYLPNQLPIFALGIFIFFLIRDNIKIISLEVIKVSVLLISSLLVDVLVFKITPFHMLFCFLYIFLATTLSKRDHKAIVNPILINIGKVSFSMYIVHFAVLFWLIKMNIVDFINVNNQSTALLNYVIRFIVLLTIAFVFSYAFYKLIEVPFQHLGKKIICNVANYNLSGLVLKNKQFKIIRSWKNFNLPSHPQHTGPTVYEQKMQIKEPANQDVG